MLSEAKRDEQNQVLQKKIADYDAFVQRNWGPQGQVTKLNEQFLKPIVDRVHKIVTTIGTDESYSIILDAADGNIIFGDRTLDLTDRVLDSLKKEDSGGLPPTSASSAGPLQGGSSSRFPRRVARTGLSKGVHDEGYAGGGREGDRRYGRRRWYRRDHRRGRHPRSPRRGADVPGQSSLRALPRADPGFRRHRFGESP